MSDKNTLGIFQLEGHAEPIREPYANKADFLQRVADNDDGDVLWATWDGIPVAQDEWQNA